MKNLLWLPLFLLLACNQTEDSPSDVDYREEMRQFVIGISEYTKATDSAFIIIPQNGIELVTKSGDEEANPHEAYLDAIDGHGQEDLFYGYNNDDEATPLDDNVYLRAFLNLSKLAGNVILVTDYCSTPSKMDDSYERNRASDYVSFAADHRELDNFPSYPSLLVRRNNAVVTSLSQVKNFLYLINPENYNSKQDFIAAIRVTNYDLLIMDLFFKDGQAFSASEIAQLRSKANGGQRLVIAYMSIGEAEDYRYYWQTDWNANKPAWLDIENPDWEGNFKVMYWHSDWQSIIYGNDNSYAKKILDADFDGLYLDIIDGYEYFE